MPKNKQKVMHKLSTGYSQLTGYPQVVNKNA